MSKVRDIRSDVPEHYATFYDRRKKCSLNVIICTIDEFSFQEPLILMSLRTKSSSSYDGQPFDLVYSSICYNIIDILVHLLQYADLRYSDICGEKRNTVSTTC